MQSLGDRMKENYENRYRFYLTRRTPVVIRLDGKAFHTITKKCDKPFDGPFCTAMDVTAGMLVNDIQGSKLAYVQSDEISILLTDFDRFNTDAWFDYNIQKIVSVSAGMASAYFSQHWESYVALGDKLSMGIFDCRAFNLPKEEVCNYFIWRQQDWFKNSLQMLARAHFSHKQLKGKKTQDLHDMLYKQGINWTEQSNRYKNGCCYIKIDGEWLMRSELIFTKEREVVENLLISIEE